MQKFNQKYHQKFCNYFQIKDKPSANDIKLIEKTYKYIRYIKYIPWICFVGIWNSVSMNCSTKNSDIDLFIITKEKRLWLVRFLVTLIFTLLNQRKTKNKHSERFCLSFFCTNKAMDFSSIAIDNDIYLYFWIIYLKPILDVNNTYENFIKSQTWCDLSEYKYKILENKKYIKYSYKSSYDFAFFDFFEILIKSIFIKKTNRSYKKLDNKFWVIINDNMLKFHNWDKRKEISNFIFKKNIDS